VNPEPASDEELAFLAGREQTTAAGRSAEEELFSRYDERVYAWCRRVVRDHDRALDLAQDALLLAHRALPSFEGRCRFSSWLFAIARNRCLRELKRERRWQEVFLDTGMTEGTGEDPEKELESREELDRALVAVESCLDPNERLALQLRCEEGLPVEEITLMLGLTNASGARGLLQTARRKLRTALRERSGGGTRIE